MKKLILIATLSILSGCTLINAYSMAHFDPNEYKLITDIRAEAQADKAQCGDPLESKANANRLASDTKLFQLYSEHIPKNKDMIVASKDLQEIAQGLADMYSKESKVSSAFCQIKFQSIEQSANKLQIVLGGRPR